VSFPWFANEPVDESFFGTAPFKLSDTIEIGRPAAEVWAEITADDALHWCKMVGSLEWTSPRPFGVGTTRTVKALAGTNQLHEHFFLWEEGRRKSFYVIESTAPLFKRFAEDYLVEPVSDTSCRFIWRIVGEPRLALTNPVTRRLLGTLFRDTRRHYGVE